MDGVSIVTNMGGVEVCGFAARCSAGQTDSDHESVVSDYSEMADPVKEHLASIHILQEAELRFGSVLGLPVTRPWLAMQRRPDEDEMEFLQRRRKMNFLSLAQEFAAIKKANPDALPFNLHRQMNDVSDREEVNEESEEVSLAQEFAVVSCVDKTTDEVSQVGASCSEPEVHECDGFDCTTNTDHICQTSNVVTNSCSSRMCLAAEENCNSELSLTVSNVPDVVQGLCDSSDSGALKQLDVNHAEVDHMDDCHSFNILTECDDSFKTANRLTANSVMSHSKNVGLVSLAALMIFKTLFYVLLAILPIQLGITREYF